MLELLGVATLLSSQLDYLVLCLAKGRLFAFKVIALLVYDPVQIIDTAKTL
jgi:hypothetical protein